VLAAEELQLVGLINGARSAAGLGQLSVEQRVMDVARWRTVHWAAPHYSSHEIPAGACYRGTCWDRPVYVWDILGSVGIGGMVGENLWLGGGAPDQLAESAQVAFSGSPSHLANMLGADWHFAGTGMAPVPWSPAVGATHVVEVFTQFNS
jgi:uncharacterized protein YkwD